MDPGEILTRLPAVVVNPAARVVPAPDKVILELRINGDPATGYVVLARRRTRINRSGWAARALSISPCRVAIEPEVSSITVTTSLMGCSTKSELGTENRIPVRKPAFESEVITLPLTGSPINADPERWVMLPATTPPFAVEESRTKIVWRSCPATGVKVSPELNPVDALVLI